MTSSDGTRRAFRPHVAEERYLTVQEVAQRLGATTDTVRRWVRTGRLTGFLPGGEKLGYRIPEHDIDRLARRLPSGGPRHAVPEGESKQEALLAALVLASDDAIFSVASDGVITSWNPGAERLFGYATAEVIGQPSEMLVPPSREDELRHIREEALRGRSVRNLETVRRRKDGILMDVCITNSPVLSPSGEVAAIAVITRDITEAAQLRRRLEESEQRYRSLFDHAPDPIAYHDLSGRITSLNAAGAQTLGAAMDAVRGIDFRTVVAPEDRARADEHFTRAARGEPQVYEVAIIRSDGIRARMEVTYVPVVVSGRVTGVFGIARDVTEQREHEAALRTLLDRSPDIVARFDRELRHVYVNPAVERATGRPAADFLGRTNRQLGFPASLVDRWDAALRRVFATGLAATLTFDFPTPGGPQRFESRLVPERGPAGAIESVLVVSRNIAEGDVEVRR